MSTFDSYHLKANKSRKYFCPHQDPALKHWFWKQVRWPLSYATTPAYLEIYYLYTLDIFTKLT